MSKKVLVNLNLNKNQIENAAAHNLSSAPSSPVVGQEYFNTSDKQKYIWDGTSWVSETAQGTTYTAGNCINSTALSNSTIAVESTSTIRPTTTATDTTLPTELAVAKGLDKKQDVFLGSVNYNWDEDDGIVPVTVSAGYSEINGSTLIVDFGNKACLTSSAKLQVNFGTARDVYVNDSKTGIYNMLRGIVEFIFYNNNYYVVNKYRDTNTTYTNGTGLNLSNNTFSVDFTVVATATQGTLAETALQPNDNISELNNNAGYITGIDSSMVTTALGYTPYNSTNPSGYQANVIETIKVNNTALTPASKTVNISVPTTATEVGALPSSTKYGATFVASLNTTDYKLTMTLKDQDGNTLGTSQVVDFPVESVVVGGSYDNTNKKIILTLQNGNTIDVPVGDLVAGLQSEITSTNKLSADLVNDSTTTNKFVTAANKTTWNNKQDAISDLATIRSGASAGSTAAQTYTTTNPALTQTGGACTWTVTHNLGSNIIASVYDATTNEEVIVTIEKTSSTVATIKMNSASNITAGAYRVVVIGK